MAKNGGHVHTEPVLVKRKCGGWLAVSAAEAEFRIGVIGESEADAREKFSKVLSVWTRARAAELAERAAH